MIKQKINLKVYSSIDEFVNYCVEYIVNHLLEKGNLSENIELFSTALYSNIYSSLDELGVEFIRINGSQYSYINVAPIVIKSEIVKVCKDFEIKISRYLVEQSYPFDVDLRFGFESLSDKEWNDFIESFVTSMKNSGGYTIE